MTHDVTHETVNFMISGIDVPKKLIPNNIIFNIICKKKKKKKYSQFVQRANFFIRRSCGNFYVYDIGNLKQLLLLSRKGNSIT